MTKVSDILTYTVTTFINNLTNLMVTVVQLVERLIVVQVVVGSSPIGHPIFFFFNSRFISYWTYKLH